MSLAEQLETAVCLERPLAPSCFSLSTPTLNPTLAGCPFSAGPWIDLEFKSGSPSGFVFYVDRAEARAAVDRLRSTPLNSGGQQVTVELADASSEASRSCRRTAPLPSCSFLLLLSSPPLFSLRSPLPTGLISGSGLK